MSSLNECKWSFVQLIPNKLLKRSPNFVQKYYFRVELLINCWISIRKYLRYQYVLHRVTPRLLPSIQFCNFNKKHSILAKLCTNNAQSIGSRNAKFQLNPLRQKIVTVVYVRWPRLEKSLKSQNYRKSACIGLQTFWMTRMSLLLCCPTVWNSLPLNLTSHFNTAVEF